MQDLLELAASRPERKLAAGEVLITQGASGGDLFVLEEGLLAIERDGVKIASVSTRGALLGEMAVLLGKATTATVRAERPTRVRVIAGAQQALAGDPQLTLRVAQLVAGRLDATSAFLVQLTKKHSSQAEQSLLKGIISALHLPSGGDFNVVNRQDLFG